MVNANEARAMYEAAMQPEAVAARAKAIEEAKDDEYRKRRIAYKETVKPVFNKIVAAAQNGQKSVEIDIGMHRYANYHDINIRNSPLTKYYNLRETYQRMIALLIKELREAGYTVKPKFWWETLQSLYTLHNYSDGTKATLVIEW